MARFICLLFPIASISTGWERRPVHRRRSPENGRRGDCTRGVGPKSTEKDFIYAASSDLPRRDSIREGEIKMNIHNWLEKERLKLAWAALPADKKAAIQPKIDAAHEQLRA